MRKAATILLLLLLSCALGAQEKGLWYDHLDYGVEWGYSGTFWDSYHYNYTSAEGERLDSRNEHLTFKSNGHLYGFVGARFARWFAADVLVGWAGVYEGRRVVPVTLRSSVFFRGYDNDGMKVFLEGGRCFAPVFGGKPIWLGKVGGGHRTMLDRHLALDFALSLQAVSDHPRDVYDPIREDVVPPGNLRRSDCAYMSLNLSVALCF